MPRAPPYVWTLIELYERGAARRPLELSTEELGLMLGLSQQGASKHLAELEKEDLIVRRRNARGASVLITKEGSDTVISIYSRLRAAVEGKAGVFEFHGTLFTGLGEGGYYVSLAGYRKQFVKLLGFEPFPGTLNLTIGAGEIELKKQLGLLRGLGLTGFVHGGRSYGPAKCFRATVESRYEAGALIIERTHHGEGVLELVAPVNLRKALSLKDGDHVRVLVQTGDATNGSGGH